MTGENQLKKKQDQTRLFYTRTHIKSINRMLYHPIFPTQFLKWTRRHIHSLATSTTNLEPLIPRVLFKWRQTDSNWWDNSSFYPIDRICWKSIRTTTADFRQINWRDNSSWDPINRMEIPKKSMKTPQKRKVQSNKRPIRLSNIECTSSKCLQTSDKLEAERNT